MDETPPSDQIPSPLPPSHLSPSETAPPTSPPGNPNSPPSSPIPYTPVPTNTSTPLPSTPKNPTSPASPVLISPPPVSSPTNTSTPPPTLSGLRSPAVSPNNNPTPHAPLSPPGNHALARKLAHCSSLIPPLPVISTPPPLSAPRNPAPFPHQFPHHPSQYRPGNNPLSPNHSDPPNSSSGNREVIYVNDGHGEALVGPGIGVRKGSNNLNRNLFGSGRNNVFVGGSAEILRLGGNRTSGFSIRPASQTLYSCIYCSKDFSTFQALGGHQNAHRQEREEARRLLAVQEVNNLIAHQYTNYFDNPQIFRGAPYDYSYSRPVEAQPRLISSAIRTPFRLHPPLNPVDYISQPPLPSTNPSQNYYFTWQADPSSFSIPGGGYGGSASVLIPPCFTRPLPPPPLYPNGGGVDCNRPHHNSHNTFAIAAPSSHNRARGEDGPASGIGISYSQQVNLMNKSISYYYRGGSMLGGQGNTGVSIGEVSGGRSWPMEVDNNDNDGENDEESGDDTWTTFSDEVDVAEEEEEEEEELDLSLRL